MVDFETGNRAVFFDRDGVLNEPLIMSGKSYAPLRYEDFKLYPEAPTAVARVKAAGFLTILVTNQPEIARGNLKLSELARMHEALQVMLDLDGIYVCPHDPAEGCECHKPEPGLLVRAAQEHGIDLSASYLIGDRWRDMGAGRNAGCTTILIETPFSRAEFADNRVRSLGEAVRIVERIKP